MKIRSKALRDHLVQVNALQGTPEVIARAKLDYRKQYKRNWKKQQRSRKELRIQITSEQYLVIKAKADKCDLRPTPYARHVILGSFDAHPILSADALLALLQLIGMATTRTMNDPMGCPEVVELLRRAEAIVLNISKKLITPYSNE